MLPPLQPSEEELKKGMAQVEKGIVLYAGIPSPEDDLEGYKKAGAKVIFFLTSEEKKQYTLKADESGVTWDDDVAVKEFLFKNVPLWMGGQIIPGKKFVEGGGSNAERTKRLGGLLFEVTQLHNFDTNSVQFLTKDRIPLRNCFRNYRYYEDGIPLKQAKNIAKGTRAVIIAAGPSLNQQWGELARIQKEDPKATFIVAGRSYRQAMKNGIGPDLVVEVEQFDWDERIWTFAPEPPEWTYLAAPLTVSPGVLSCWPNPKNIIILMDHEMASLQGLKTGEDSMDGGNSILHHMFNLAIWFGCSEICLAGVDLSYPKGSMDTHAGGTFPLWPKTVLRQEHAFQDPLEVPCTSGGMVMGSPGYRNFCIFLEFQIHNAKKANPNLKIYNFSPHGQKIEGTEYKDIALWGLQPPSSSPDASSPLPLPGPEASTPGSGSIGPSNASTPPA